MPHEWDKSIFRDRNGISPTRSNDDRVFRWIDCVLKRMDVWIDLVYWPFDPKYRFWHWLLGLNFINQFTAKHITEGSLESIKIGCGPFLKKTRKVFLFNRLIPLKFPAPHMFARHLPIDAHVFA